MNLLQIIFKQMRQRALSTWLTLLSVLLGTALAIAILILHREGEHLFGQTDFGYDVLVGPPKGSPLQLTLNTVYHLDRSPGVLPYSVYEDLSRKTPPPEGRRDFRANVRWAVPLMVGDSFNGRRIVGTSPLMFGVGDDGQPATGEKFQYRLDKSYEFAEGRAFAPRKFEAVVGAETAKSLNLRLYDPAKTDEQNLAAGGAFRATHGMPTAGQTPDIHKPVWRIVGILKPTSTANDRVLFVPYISLYAIAEHEEGVARQALARSKIDPTKIARSKLPDVLRNAGINPDQLPERIRRDLGLVAATSRAVTSGDLLEDAHAATGAADHHDDHHEEEHDPFTLDAQGNIVPELPQSQWELSAVLVQSRSGFANQQIVWTFTVADDRATAVNPASVMREFFNTFLSNSATVLLVIAVLVSVVAAASIMTTIYNSVSARLREIAILRALGATRGKILTLISLEAALIGFFGSVGGLLVGHLLCALGSEYAEQTVGESINWAKVSGVEIGYLAAVVVLAFAAGLVPALKAYRTSVADNLTAS